MIVNDLKSFSSELKCIVPLYDNLDFVNSDSTKANLTVTTD